MKDKGKNNLIPSDFHSCPVWKYDEDSDLFYPVGGESDLPDLARDLKIRAVFMAPTGEVLEGYVVGVDRIFSMGLFLGDRVYHLNKNLRGPSRDQVEEYLAKKFPKSNLTYDGMFPLHFETRWDSVGFVNFSGVFDMS